MHAQLFSIHSETQRSFVCMDRNSRSPRSKEMQANPTCKVQPSRLNPSRLARSRPRNHGGDAQQRPYVQKCHDPCQVRTLAEQGALNVPAQISQPVAATWRFRRDSPKMNCACCWKSMHPDFGDRTNFCEHTRAYASVLQRSHAPRPA